MGLVTRLFYVDSDGTEYKFDPEWNAIENSDGDTVFAFSSKDEIDDLIAFLVNVRDKQWTE